MRIKNLKRSKSSSLGKFKYVLPVLAIGLATVLSSFSFEGSTLFTDVESLSIKKGNAGDPEVDKQPEFKGGMEALFSYMMEEVKYPKEAANAGVEGKVFVEFTVTKEGKIKDAKVAKGAEESLDKEALRVVNAMPDWTPGEKDGKKVDVKMTLPIAFKL
jgi:protein TonB